MKATICIPNRIAAQGLYALMFAATVEMMRQQTDKPGPRGSRALITMMRYIVIQSLPDDNDE